MSHYVCHNQPQVMRQTIAATERVAVPVARDLRRSVRERPEELGLPAGVSEASRWSRVVEAGIRTLREEQRRAVRLELYSAWADDPERCDAVRLASERAIQTGLI